MATFSVSEEDAVFSGAEFNGRGKGDEIAGRGRTRSGGGGGGGKKGSADSALTLKRVRDLDVASASAEWRVAEGVLVIFA